jgi:PAS domain S-box-containing protein
MMIFRDDTLEVEFTMSSESLISVSQVAPRFLEELQPGHHICCIYESEQEHRELLTKFLLDGLERHEKVAYILDARDAEVLEGYLRDEGVDPAPFLASGQLVFLTQDETYAKEGSFDPDRMIDTLRDETRKALADGFTAFRVTGEMTWALRNLSGSDRLIEYEAKLNHFFHGSEALAVCQYDRRRFSPEILLDVLDTHPIAVTGTQVLDNFYYLPPDEFLSPDRVQNELQHRLENLRLHQRAEQNLRESEGRYRQVLENLKVGVVVHAPDTSIKLANPRALELLGITEDQALGRRAIDPLWSFVNEDGSAMTADEYPVHRVLADGAPLRDIVAGIDQSGTDELVWVSIVAFPVLSDTNGLDSVVVTFLDITESRSAEQRLRESLIEKEVLLKEIHHRVKNNLQVISSLLSLQARQAASEEVAAALEDGVQRVRGMAMVHEKLCESRDLANVDFGEYIEAMTRELTGAAGASDLRINLEMDIDTVPLTVDQAVPCGQIVSELLSNALKHAFPGNRAGTIRVSIREQGHRHVELQVADDGVGFPRELTFDDPKSLGLWLVTAFTQQLDGQVELETPPEGGTVVRVTFAQIPPTVTA